MKLDGQEVAFEGGTLDLKTSDMAAVERVLEAMANRGTVMLDTTEYQPVSVDVRMKSVVTPDISVTTFSHKHEFRPVATIKLRA